MLTNYMARRFSLPSLSYTAQSVWRLKWDNAPFLIANLVLIGLISYRLIKDDELSKDEKKNISYAEIAFSFIGSLMVLFLNGFLILLVLVGLFTTPAGIILGITRVLFLIFVISILLLNPFGITVLRVALGDKLSDLQEKIISGIAIPSALLSIYITANILNGAFLS